MNEIHARREARHEKTRTLLITGSVVLGCVVIPLLISATVIVWAKSPANSDIVAETTPTAEKLPTKKVAEIPAHIQAEGERLQLRFKELKRESLFDAHYSVANFDTTSTVRKDLEEYTKALRIIYCLGDGTDYWKISDRNRFDLDIVIFFEIYPKATYAIGDERENYLAHFIRNFYREATPKMREANPISDVAELATRSYDANL